MSFEDTIEKLAREQSILRAEIDRLKTLGSSALTIIEDVELAASAVDIDFTSIPQNFKNLLLLGSIRSDRVATNDGLGLRFNGDAGANYDRLGADIHHNAVLETFESFATTMGTIMTVAAANAPASVFSSVEARITDYADAGRHKEILSRGMLVFGTASGNIRWRQNINRWRDTSAITRVQLFPINGTNFVGGSRVTLYGVA